MSGKPGRRITFAAFPGDTVIVSGADLLEGPWERTEEAWRRLTGAEHDAVVEPGAAYRIEGGKIISMNPRVGAQPASD